MGVYIIKNIIFIRYYISQEIKEYLLTCWGWHSQTCDYKHMSIIKSVSILTYIVLNLKYDWIISKLEETWIID